MSCTGVVFQGDMELKGVAYLHTTAHLEHVPMVELGG